LARDRAHFSVTKEIVTESITKRKLGRPRTGVGLQIGMRWHKAELAAIDEWRRRQLDEPSRTDAIRRLVQLGLVARPRRHSK